MLLIQLFESELHFLPYPQNPKTYQNRIKTSSGDLLRIRTDRNNFAGLAVELGQRLALHLEFHLRVFLEHLGVRLPEELRHPLVGHTARTQPCSVGGAEVVEPEVGDTGFPERTLPGLLEILLRLGRLLCAGKKTRSWAGEFHLAAEGLRCDVR